MGPAGARYGWTIVRISQTLRELRLSCLNATRSRAPLVAWRRTLTFRGTPRLVGQLCNPLGHDATSRIKPRQRHTVRDWMLDWTRDQDYLGLTTSSW